MKTKAQKEIDDLMVDIQTDDLQSRITMFSHAVRPIQRLIRLLKQTRDAKILAYIGRLIAKYYQIVADVKRDPHAQHNRKIQNDLRKLRSFVANLSV